MYLKQKIQSEFIVVAFAVIIVGCASSKYNTLDYREPSLNRWSIPPPSAEHDTLIVKRITNELDYLIAYFCYAIRNNYSSVSLEYLSTPYVFFINGIGLETREKVPRRWLKNFYNEKQAWRAYEIISFSFSKAQWKDEGNIFKSQVEFLRQLNQNLTIPAEAGGPDVFLSRPTKKRTKNELIDRLAAEIKFIEDEIQKLIDRKRAEVEPTEEYSIFRVTPGKIRIVEKQVLSEKWINSFHDKSEMEEALDLINKAIIAVGTFKYAGTEYESLVYNLSQIREKLVGMKN